MIKFFREIRQNLLSEGKTGEIGDGKIFVYDVLEAYRIRNTDKGEQAL